jgi:hypothetical protein
MALTICLMGSCIWCLALVTNADSTQPGPAIGPFKPVASVESLMHGQKTFFKKIGEALQNPSMPDRGEEIEEAAEVLAELANVNRYNNDKADYRAWATQLRDTALRLAHEAEEKNVNEKRMKKLYMKLKDTCGACHDVYQE